MKIENLNQEQQEIIQDAKKAGFNVAHSRTFVDLYKIDEDGQFDGVRLREDGSAMDLFEMQKEESGNVEVIKSEKKIRKHLGI